jgi:hypothetical protein
VALYRQTLASHLQKAKMAQSRMHLFADHSSQSISVNLSLSQSFSLSLSLDSQSLQVPSVWESFSPSHITSAKRHFLPIWTNTISPDTPSPLPLSCAQAFCTHNVSLFCLSLFPFLFLFLFVYLFPFSPGVDVDVDVSLSLSLQWTFPKPQSCKLKETAKSKMAFKMSAFPRFRREKTEWMMTKREREREQEESNSTAEISFDHPLPRFLFSLRSL